MSRKTIVELDCTEAKKFFLESKNYVNFDLPEYFDFTNLLNNVSVQLGNYNVRYFFAKDKKTNKKIDPRDLYEVNKKIFGNKDGELAWRPYEIVNPVLYVSLVQILTKKENWVMIIDRFNELKTPQVDAASIPTLRSRKKSARAEQIRAWWEKFEQNCVAQGLYFQYVFETDVSDCYSSIYTHAITWALYGKDVGYEKRGHCNLGNELDKLFQMMHHRQTNGIPQGNTVSDFVAELIFAYADNLLIKKLDEAGIQRKEYKVIRYRDDYRIFSNRSDLGSRVLKELTEILAELGLKLSPQKTNRSTDIVLASIKKDKIDELFVPNIKQEKDNFAKWLIQIYATILKHPNSGKTPRQLGDFHQQLLEYLDEGHSLRHYEKVEVMLSIVVNIAIKNPKYYNITMAVASLLIRAAGESRRGLLVERVIDKFAEVPNTGLLDLWIQRVSYPIDPLHKFDESLTSVVDESDYTDNSNVWNIDWLKPAMRDIVRDTKLVKGSLLKEIREQQQISISREEVDMFVDVPS